MIYKTKLPEQNHNVSHNHPLRELAVLLGGVVGIVLVVFWALGYAVDFAVDRLPPAKEKKIFAGFSKKFDAASDVPAEKVAFLQDLTDSLGSCMEVGYSVEVRVVDSEIINAFALPGGVIVVFTGLLDKVRSENGLAFVLAHELGHYKHRDHLRGMGRGLVIAAVSAVLTGSDSWVTQLLAPTNEFGMARYSQARESGADSIALDTVQCYYGHVGGATDFFSSMLEGAKGNDPGFRQYFASHPHMVKRLDALNEMAEENGYAFGPVQEFHL